MRSALVLTVLVAVLTIGCAGPTRITYPNVTPDKPEIISATVTRPSGPGPFPAVVLLHGCGGVSPQLERWARRLADRGYTGLVIDSFGPRRVKGDCSPESPDDIPITARLDDAFGALRWLQAQPWVRGDRVGAVGFSQGGAFAMSVINGPSLERAARRGVKIPEPGFAAGVGVYPGGCKSLIPQLAIKPLLVLIGAADDWTLPESCQQMVESMKSRGADARIVLYPGAYHYFDVEGQKLEVLDYVGNDNKPGGRGATVGYQPEAAAGAYREVELFFGQHLKR
ncbi:MAG TPA: dienelactone hydrolase family protein [Pseudomonadales bacterium]|nr:dienelactone hydrolase family protein [Pseudomonadales bacterium]